MNILKIGLLLTFIYYCSGAEQDVIELGDSDFASGVAKYETVLVMFYAPW